MQKSYYGDSKEVARLVHIGRQMITLAEQNVLYPKDDYMWNQAVVCGNKLTTVGTTWTSLNSLSDLSKDEKKALLECKHTNAFTNEVKTADKYKAQIQHYMMVYGADKMYLSMFFGNMKWGLVEVLPDKEFQEKLLAAEVLFWHMVTTKTPPPDFVDFNNFDQQIKEHNNGRQIIPILSRQSKG